MRITGIGLLVFLLLVSLPVMAEEEELLVSTLFFETDIREALDELAMQTGVNIIFDDSVRGTVTLDLEDVPLERALRMVLISGGYSFRKIEDFYLVGLPDPRSPAFQSLSETETIKLEYLSTQHAMELTPSFYEDFLKVSHDQNMITITAPLEIIESFKEHLQKIDVRPRQLQIKVLATEISKGALQELGTSVLEYSFEAGQEVKDDWLTSFGMELGKITLETDVFGKLLTDLHMLEGEERAEITADPWVVVADRQQVDLFVGEEQIIILEPEGAPARIERVNVGVLLNIVPEILNDEEIRLAISPEISHLRGEEPKGLSIRRSELSTTVYARDGQTLVLSGITIEEKLEQARGFPVLRNIPILRWIFGLEEETVVKRELLLFITPEII